MANYSNPSHDRLAKRVVAAAVREIDRMPPDELLTFVDRVVTWPVGPSTRQVLAHAMRRLDALTA